MNNIPDQLKFEMAADSFYSRCCVTGVLATETKVEWHHNLIYAGRQVQEKFAILPLRQELHQRADNRALRPVLNWIMLNRATEEELTRFSKGVNLFAKRDRLNLTFKRPWAPGTYFELTPGGNPAIKRTGQQNKALHLFYEMLATSLNDAGLDQRKVLKPGVSIPWTKASIKEQLWRPIQKAMYEKRSTTDLLKQQEIDRIHETLMRHLAEKFGVEYIPFPSYEHGHMERAPLKKDTPRYQHSSPEGTSNKQSG